MDNDKNAIESLRSTRGWKGTIKGFRGIEALLVFAVTMLVFFNTLCRYVFTINLPWMEEILLIISMWMYFLGAMLGSEEESHISGDLVTSSIKSGKGKKIVTVIVNFINVVISGYFTILTIKYCIKQTRLGATTAVLRLPKSTSQYAILFGLVFVFLFSVYHFIRYLVKKPESFVKNEDVAGIDDGSQEGEE